MTRLFLTDTADAGTLLRLAAREVWGLEELPPIVRDPGGKPRFLRRPELCFNLSHSGPYALCALSGGEVGADVEAVRPRRSFLPPKALSEMEYQWFQARGSRWEDFYTLWTLKEARVKCLGTGLNRPARTLAVPLLEPGQTGELDGLTFTAYGGNGWRCALCGPPGPAPLEWLPIQEGGA